MKKIYRLITECCASFAPRFFTFLLIALIIRTTELIWSDVLFGLPENFLTIILSAYTKDILSLLTFACWLLFPYFIFFAINKKSAHIFFIVFAVLFSLIQLALVKYFLTALVPLGGDIWGYSLAEIKQTIGAAGGVSLIAVIAGISIITLIVFLFTYLSKKIKINTAYLIGLVSFSFLLNIFSLASKSDNWKPTSNDFSNALSTNKIFFFYRQSMLHFFPPVYDVDIYADNYIIDYSNQTNFNLANSFDYTDQKNFPFLHTDQTQDVLSPFFDTTSSKPNIVFIIVEGLGRSFTNEGATLGNFTPFLDSLSQHSLYWPNFLSEAGRTFAVLPSIMGSLPFGENGFAELGNAMPQNMNLLSLLKYNGYHTAFYYGGDSHFDNMDVFIKHSNGDVNDMRSFPANYPKQPSSNGFSWGYGDKELFKHYLETTISNAQPRFDVLLTVSMHSPFLINEQQKYLELAEKRIHELDLTENKKDNAEKFKAQFASIMYTDDAVKNFISEYSEKPSFKNTIFIITGDHRMPEIPMENKLERYHVPLIVYSPLLKRTATFQSISTHYDIAPSILAFLKTRYHADIPAQTTFMGTGIDTTRTFGNSHVYPLKQTKTDLVDFLYGDYLLNNNQLYQITSNMDIAPVNDDDLKNKISAAFDEFRQKNTTITANAKLLPDSLYIHYQPKNSSLAIK